MEKIAVFFPGIGYHNDKPLLYYSRKLAMEAGFEKCVNVGYSYQKENLRGNREKIREAVEHLLSQAEESLKGIDWQHYDDILFVSKSIGTAVALSYAGRHKIKCAHILYTPLEETFECIAGSVEGKGSVSARGRVPSTESYSTTGSPAETERYSTTGKPAETENAGTQTRATAFSGTADPWVRPGEIERHCQKANVTLRTIEDANHSLETPDTMKNICIIKDIMQATKEFINNCSNPDTVPAP